MSRLLLGTTLRGLTAGYAALLLFLTHVPWLSVSFGQSTPVEADKFLHFLAYGGLGILLGINLVHQSPPGLRTTALAYLTIAGFALGDECTQPIFGRVTEVYDWIADLVGGVGGFALVWVASLGYASAHGTSTRKRSCFHD